MTVRVQEIAPGIHRLSTYVAEIAPPIGFTFNQYLVEADEPLLFHCGMRGMFGEVSRAVAGSFRLRGSNGSASAMSKPMNAAR